MYVNSYYALIKVNYFFMRFSITSKDYDIFNSSAFAFTLFCVAGGAIILFIYRVIIKYFGTILGNTNSKSWELVNS